MVEKKVTHLNKSEWVGLTSAISSAIIRRPEITDEDLLQRIVSRQPLYTEELVAMAISTARKFVGLVNNIQPLFADSWYTEDIADIAHSLRPVAANIPETVVIAAIREVVFQKMNKMAATLTAYHVGMTPKDAAKEVIGWVIGKQQFGMLIRACEARLEVLAANQARLNAERAQQDAKLEESRRIRANALRTEQAAQERQKLAQRAKKLAKRSETAEMVYRRPRIIVKSAGKTLYAFQVESEEELAILATAEFSEVSGIAKDAPHLVALGDEIFWITKSASGRIKRQPVIADPVVNEASARQTETTNRPLLPDKFGEIWVVNGSKNAIKALIIPEILWHQHDLLLSRVTLGRHILPNMITEKSPIYKMGRTGIINAGVCRPATPEEKREAKRLKEPSVFDKTDTDWRSMNLIN